MKGNFLTNCAIAVALGVAVASSAGAQKPKESKAVKVEMKAQERIDRTTEKAREKDVKTAAKIYRTPGSVQSQKAVEKIHRTDEKAADQNEKVAEKAALQARRIAGKDATARCRDGTFTVSVSRAGACGRHGGVVEWLRKK